jgi:hypothetical protein
MNRTGMLVLACVCLAAVSGCGQVVVARPAADTTVLGDDDFRVVVHTDGKILRKNFGPRFDNTGFVSSAKVKGKEFLGPFGLSGEFGILGTGVLGYDRAKPGEEFVKIGLGRLKRLDDKPYEFSRKYQVARLFPTQVKTGRDTVTFTQDGEMGAFKYRYMKRYRVDRKLRLITVEYELTNTGRATWEFEHYNHNWLRFGADPVGPPYFVRPEFGLDPDKRKGMVFSGTQMRLNVKANGAYLSSRKKAPVQRNRLHVGRQGGTQSVDISNNFPLSRFALYADQRGICPETFHRAQLGPRQQSQWKRVYVFNLK